MRLLGEGGRKGGGDRVVPILGHRWPKTVPSRKVDILNFRKSIESQSTAHLSKPGLAASLIMS